MKTIFLLFVVALLINTQETRGQIVINELSNANKVIPYNEDDESEDWIEIHNKGSVAVNLLNYSLTDKPDNLYKWLFPSLIIQPGQFLMVYASGQSSKAKSLTKVIHWETAISNTDKWKYFVGEAEPESNWSSNSFDDQNWASGIGGIGSGEQDTCLRTQIPVSASSVYMRRTFDVVEISKIEEAIFHLDFTGGFIAYLNGVEIARKNMAKTKSSHNTLAISENEAILHKGEMPQGWKFNNEFIQKILRPGKNVLSIQVHKSNTTFKEISSHAFLTFGISDLTSYYDKTPFWMSQPQTALHANFKLSIGEDLILSNAQGYIIDECLVPYMQLGHSYGRQIDGTGPWRIFTNPTPNASNNGQASYSGYELPPIISLKAGFYSEAQTVSITPQIPGPEIRYTTNGDVPKQWDKVYNSPITVSSTKVVTARAFGSGDKLPSPPVKRSYFIGENITLPVISITTDSLNLWDYNTGIYAKGPGAEPVYPYFGANFWKNWETEAHVEFFSADKQLKAELNTGLRIHGGYSRGFDQKSFRFHFRSNYGASSLNYPIIEEISEEIKSFKRLVIRNGGQDFYKTRFRDALFQRLSKKTNLDCIAYEPAVVFLNGQYWGLYGIRERTDKHYLQSHHKVNPEAIDLLEHKGYIIVREGSDTGFYNLHNYIMAADPKDPMFLKTVDSRLHLDNFADFFVVQTFISNTDWMGTQTGNMRFWREQGGAGRWRYYLVDTDFGMGLRSGTLPSDNTLKLARNPPAQNHHSRMFDKLLNNTEFRNYFINRYADLLNTAYHLNNIKIQTEGLKAALQPEMPRHVVKWKYGTSVWYKSIGELLVFAEQRIDYARQQIQDEFGLLKQVNLNLDVEPKIAGKIQINTVIPDSMPWQGVYFDGVPVTITAIGNPGYEFSFWSPNALITDVNNAKQVVNLNSEQTYTANFIWTSVEEEKNSPFKLTISPNPSSGNMRVEIMLSNGFSQPYKAELIGNDGKLLKQWALHGNQVLNLNKNNFSTGLFLLKLSSDGHVTTKKLMFN